MPGCIMSTVDSNTQPLRDLARRRMREQGWTYEQVARNAQGLRGKSWFNIKLTEPHRPRPLKDVELQAIAAGLQVRVEQVRAADLAGHNLRDDRQDDSGAPITTAVQHFPDGLRIVRTVYEQIGDDERAQLERDLEMFVRTWQAMRAREATEGDGR